MKWTNPLSTDTDWHRKISNRHQKVSVAERVADRLKQGDVIGVGSGSTSYLALLELASRRDIHKLSFSVITTSIEMDLLCASLGISVTSLNVERPDWSFDGADEVDLNNNLIKGRGGALLREKLLIASSPEAYILIDSSKRVNRLGEKSPVPVEVHPGSVQLVESSLAKLPEVSGIILRQASGKDGPIITEQGNLILDVSFHNIPADMEQRLKNIVGVVETGLFIGYNFIIL